MIIVFYLYLLVNYGEVVSIDCNQISDSSGFADTPFCLQNQRLPGFGL